MSNEGRGRNPKELDEELITEILSGTDQLLTTQQIRRKYNKEKEDTVAWETMNNRLNDSDRFQSFKVADRTGWDTK